MAITTNISLFSLWYTSQNSDTWQSSSPLQHIYSRLVLIQWGTSLQSNIVSHWLGANPKSALFSHLPLDKMAAISQMISSDAFSLMKVLYFGLNFTEVCYLGSNWQYPSIGLDNGLAPNRWQAIIWTTADLIHWRIYAAPEGDELILFKATQPY